MVAIELNHMIVPAKDGAASARWFARVFGLPEPTRFGHFWQIRTANGVDLDFDTYGEDEQPPTGEHYAFLVGEDDFDAIHGRIVAEGIPHWADPGRHDAGSINHRDGGRGVYFASNDDHLLEIITRPYGG